MKIYLLLLILTISLSFYSCESPTNSQSNPLSYGSELPYFLISPYIPYYQLDNRIDYVISNVEGNSKDSTSLRATFYDNSTFRDAGNLYMNNTNIDKQNADNLFNIRQLIDGFIDFGLVYFSEIEKINYSDSLTLYALGEVIPKFAFTIPNLDTSLIVLNVIDLKEINKNIDHKIVTNDIGFSESRIRIYNDKNQFSFYANFKNEVNITSESLNKIPNGNYKFECLKGYYKIDTLSNGEQLITNVVSSYTFNTIIK